MKYKFFGDFFASLSFGFESMKYISDWFIYEKRQWSPAKKRRKKREKKKH